jgi:Polyketide cyclase / dehydrase and lipid transport
MQRESRDHHRISTSATVPTSAERAYAVLADYRNGHPHILPEQFSDMTVESGGIGAGTIIRFDMRLLGRKQTCRAAITESPAGRVLVETVLDGRGIVTTFTVDAGPAGQARVTIATEVPVRSGLPGSIERFLFTRLLAPIYKRELALLAAYVTDGQRDSSGVDAGEQTQRAS